MLSADPLVAEGGWVCIAIVQELVIGCLIYRDLWGKR